MKQISTEQEFIFKSISLAAREIGQPVYVVGGFVRDFYLNRLKTNEELDIDFVTIGSGINLAKSVAQLLNSSKIAVFKNFGTAQLTYKNHELEFVGARKESYDRKSRKPVVEDGTLKDDQERRDFTINAMSWSLNENSYMELIDPFNGMDDLEQKIIKTPLAPSKTFDDDPLRMMRAIRFATQLNFEIEHETYEAIKRMAERITIVSNERILSELNKIIMSPKPSKGFSLLFHAGLLEYIFPELVNLHGVKEMNGIRHKDNFWHTLQVLDNISQHTDHLWLRWAAIMHDIAKPATQRFSQEHGWTFHGHDSLGASMTKKIFRRMGLPLDDRLKYVQKLVRLHLRPIAISNEVVTDSAVRRLAFESGSDFEDLMLLCRADITSKNDHKVQKYLRNFDLVEEKVRVVDEKDKLRNFQNPIDGLEIMQIYNLKPGPVVGKIKNAIQEAILEGTIENTYEAAFSYMEMIKDDYLQNNDYND